jgi:hypothetical protein
MTGRPRTVVIMEDYVRVLRKGHSRRGERARSATNRFCPLATSLMRQPDNKVARVALSDASSFGS